MQIIKGIGHCSSVDYSRTDGADCGSISGILNCGGYF